MPGVAGLTTRRLVAALIALVVVFVAVVAVGEVIAPPASAVSSPSKSLLRLVEDVFPPRRLTVAQIERGGPTCLEGSTLVVPVGGGCTFIIPNGVHVVEFRRVPGSPAMTVTFTQTGDLTQNIDTGQPGPDPGHPLQLRVATVHNGDTVTLYGCRGPGSCRLVVAG
jgi:hypothetical protein